jgi:16S rRNA (guanine527-N7)-methyltransferase
VNLLHVKDYEAYGLDEGAQAKLAVLGDLLLQAPLNVTGLKDPGEIERVHFLDSLSLLTLPQVRPAGLLADVGSGGGLPALVLALALPHAEVTAIESVGKKCEHIAHCATMLELSNLNVRCMRAEDCGRGEDRARYDLVVSRALDALPVVAEYSMPLLRVGGVMVAMKGAVSDQECTHALAALGILGSDAMEAVQLFPFAGARSRVVFVAEKQRDTPAAYPRRTGVPHKRPLGRSTS